MSQPDVPNMLTVIIRDESPLRYVNEPPTYRTVHVPLTLDQIAMLALGENEAINNSFLERGGPQVDDKVELPAIDVEAMRANLHATFNGGHREPETIGAFHHGMDTVCNVLDSYQKRESTNGILPAAGKDRT